MSNAKQYYVVRWNDKSGESRKNDFYVKSFKKLIKDLKKRKIKVVTLIQRHW